MHLFNLKPLSLITLLLVSEMLLAKIVPANPSNYRALLLNLQAGDIMQLSSGIYALGLPVSGLNGSSSQPIIITGPETGDPAVFSGNAARNTVQIDDSNHIILRHITLDGLGIPYVDAVNSRGSTHHITLEDLFIINHGGAYVPDTDHQLTNGIATRGPAWDWTIRNNIIIGAGTGMYLGNWQGTGWPFVGGLIENNLILDTLGYNIEIKQMNNRKDSNGQSITGMPSVDRKTVIRHNVFSKANNASSSSTWARPNLLVGHWPLTGEGSNDIYEIYGNLFFSNPSEALFQGEGNIALYDNLFINQSGSAVHIQAHNDLPRKINVFHNTIVASNTGIKVRDVDAAYQQRVTGNAVFSANSFNLSQQVQKIDNIADNYSSANNYLKAPFGNPSNGTLDLYPIVGGLLSGALIDSSSLQGYNNWNIDFNGNLRQQGFRGAYAGEGLNPGWQLDLIIKPDIYNSSQGAPDIIEDPLSLTTTEGETASFDVRAGGSSQIQYQWFRNNTIIDGATSSNYLVNPVLITDHASVYYCKVSNTIGSNNSTGATLTVLPDTTEPIILGALLVDLNRIDIQFSETITNLSAETVSNYQIVQGKQVLAASLAADKHTVQLQTETLSVDNVYSVTINNILDTSSNANEIRPESLVSIELEPIINFENASLPTAWQPLTPSRWSVVNEGGDQSLFLNTTNYSALSGNRLGEYILTPKIYANFSLTLEAKTNEPTGSNANADYALVFGFEDENNYYYMMFNRAQNNTALFKVAGGTRQELATATADWLTNNAYHVVEVSHLLGKIEILFDNNSVLVYENTPVPAGSIGVGSFNDSAYFDNIFISSSFVGDTQDLIFSNSFE